MQLTWYQLLFSVLLVYFVPITATKSIWCIPHGDYIIKCNRCWCVNNAIFVCGHIKCNDVPLKFWRAMKPKPTQEGAKAIEKFYEKEKGDDSLKVRKAPNISKYFEKWTKTWDQEERRKFFKWLNVVFDSLNYVVQFLAVSIVLAHNERLRKTHNNQQWER